MKIPVLVVDDEEGVRRSVKKSLEREGLYEVYGARDGAEALSVFSSRPFDVVICDIRMPGEDGLSVLAKMGSERPSCVRIVLTGYGTLEHALKALDDGVDGFILKPFDVNDLRSRVRFLYVKKQLLNTLPPKVYSELTRDVRLIFPRKTSVAVLFADINGFSRFSEGKDPEELIGLLCEGFYKPATGVIFKFGGIVDKYLGDGILSIFSDDVVGGRSVIKAAYAAREVVDLLKSSDFPLPVSVGVSYGHVVSGIVGSDYKKEFTVLGDPVNRASRLSKLAGPWEVLLDESAALCADGLELTPFLVKDEFIKKVFVLE